MALNKMTKSSTYGKNLRRSAGKMASKIVYTAMPSLTQTVVSTKEAFGDIKQFTLKGRSQLRVQNRFNKRTLLRPVNEIIQNAKDDLKSGKFYNEERMMQEESSSMSDFLGHMSGDDEYNESPNEGSMASFNKFLSSTSANSMNSARAISDTQIKTAEYLGELSTTQHTQSLVMSRQQHLEQINKLDNLEKIGLSIAEFNTKTMSDHIKATHQFYNEILSETREMKKSIDTIAKNINSKYGAGSRKKVPHDAIGNIFGGGSFNVSGYFDEVKKNIGNQVPFSMDMMKGIFNNFKASPISGLMSLASSFMMPNEIKKGTGKLDKSVQGLFSQYLGIMDQWKHGKNLSKNSFISTIQQLAGNIGAVDLTAKVNPDLSSYKNEKITLELEQKKAKAITEVIPSYLSQILKAVSSNKTEMYYNYDTGKFEDMKSAREKADNDFRKSIKYSSNNTTQFFTITADKLKFPSKQHKDAFDEDTETFLIYMYTNPTMDINYISSETFYNDMIKKGMSFRLGEFSVKMLKNIWLSATPSKRQEMMTEMMSNISLVKDMSNRRDVDLRSSGKSALYNNLSNLDKNKDTINLDPNFQKKLLLESTVSRNIDDSDIKDFEEKRRKELNIDKKKSFTKDKIHDKIGSKYSETTLGGVFNKLKERVDTISNEIDSKITKLTDTIASKTESILYGETDSFDTNPIIGKESTSPIKAKAVKVAKKVTNKSKARVVRVKRPMSNPTITATPAAQAAMTGVIDYRPYFETIDSHLRNIGTIISQDRAIHVSGDSATGSMTGIMSGASDKLKGLYGSGKEAASKIFSSMKTTFAGASNSIKSFISSIADKAPGVKDKIGDTINGIKNRAPGVKEKAKGFLSKAKDTGLDFLSKIASGIKTAGGNVSEYLKSDSFKELRGGIKGKVSSTLTIGKEFAGTLFDKIKSGGGNLLKKGKGMAIGGAISSMLGLGPIPGAIIGTLFSKNKKKKGTSEEDKQLDEMEKQDKTGEGGFLDKFKGKKKKSVLLGAGISTMLGLGPIPGALLTMIYNKKLVKKNGEEKDEEKQAEQISEGVEKAEKQSKGIGKGKKMKNLTIGAAASSLLGLGPMPGVIAASIYNKHKDKAAKKKDKEENKQAEETTKVMEEATDEKKKKGGFLSKIKNFFGKGKNIALGATASTLLGLGPLPGIVVASMYNKKKYKKKNDENETLDNTIENAKDKELAKTSESPEAKAERKKNKEYIEHVKQARKAEADGNIKKAESMETSLLNKAKASGDVEGIAATQSIIADARNSYGGGSGKSGKAEEKKEGLFSKLFGLLSGGGIFSKILGALSILGPIGLVISGIYKWITGSKGEGGGAMGTAAGMGVAAAVKKLSGGTIKGVSGLGITSTIGHAGKAIGYAADDNTQEAVGAGIKATWSGTRTGVNIYKQVTKAAAKKGTNTVVKKGTKAAAKKGLETVGKAASKGVFAKIGIGIAKLLKAIANNTMVQRILGKRLTSALKSLSSNIGTRVATSIAKRAAKNGAKAASKAAFGLSNPVGWAMTVISAVWGFISGWNDVKSILKLGPSYTPPTSLKFTCAIIKAIDDATYGIIDLIGLRDNLIELVFNLVASDSDKADYEQAKQEQKNGYEKFKAENPGTTLSEEKYNTLTNKTLWGKMWDGTKKFFGGKVDTLDNYRTDGGTTVVNYDASENTTVMVSDSSGSGGRGPSLANQSTSQIVKHARDRLSKNIYSTKTAKISEDEVNNYVKSSQYDTDNKFNQKKGFFSNLGTTIKNAAKWLGGKFSAGWNWLKSAFGSGGRGTDSSISNTTNNNYTYYSQKDPKWANQTFGRYNGKRDTVKEGGCGPTVAAMALEQLTGKQVLPSTMADLALKAGHKYDNGGTDPSFFNTAGSMYGVGFDQTPGFNKATVESLKSGVPVPLLGKNGPYGSGNHYILATGIDSSGKVSILDPQNNNNNKKYSAKSFLNTTRSSMLPNNSLTKARSKTKNNKYVKYLKSFGSGFGRGDIELTDTQIALVNEANSRVGETTFRSGDHMSGTVKNYCLGVVTAIYKAAGVSCELYDNSYDIKENDKTYNSDITSAPIGSAIVFPSKTEHGHVAIYVGNNEIVHAYGNNGIIKTTIQDIIDDGYTEVGWSWLGGTSAGTATDGVIVNGSTNTESSGSQTVIQALLSSIGINQNSDYSKLISTSLLKTIDGSTPVQVNSTPQSYGSSTFGKTHRNGTFTLPPNLGKYNTYMGWQLVTDKTSNQYKLKEAAGENFDANGFGKINNRYVVATTSTFGNVGDYLTVKMADGSTYQCIIGDIKNQNDPGCNKWGHNEGQSVIEAIVDKNSWYNRSSYDNHKIIPWNNSGGVTSVINEGNYWGRGSINANTSILPYKVKNNIASMHPSIPDRLIYGRGGTVLTDGILETSKNALNNKKALKINKSLIDSGRGITIDVPTKTSRESSNNASINKTNNKEDLMITALQNIVSLLTDIRSSNKTISEKNFSPVIGVKAGSNGVYTPNNQKSVLIDNIIAGI